jgi:hypothetical protein
MTDQGVESSRPGELVEMPSQERARLLDALRKRLMDPNGLDRETLANVEEPMDPDLKRVPA